MLIYFLKATFPYSTNRGKLRNKIIKCFLCKCNCTMEHMVNIYIFFNLKENKLVVTNSYWIATKYQDDVEILHVLVKSYKPHDFSN